MASAKRASCTSLAVTQLTYDAPSQAKPLNTPADLRIAPGRAMSDRGGEERHIIGLGNRKRGAQAHTGAISARRDNDRGRGISQLEGVMPKKFRP